MIQTLQARTHMLTLGELAFESELEMADYNAESVDSNANSLY